MKILIVSVILMVMWRGIDAGANTICDKKQALQSSTGKWAYPGYAHRAVDSITSPDVMDQGCTHTDRDDKNPWLLVDLGCEKLVTSVIITNRNNTPQRLQKFVVSVHKQLPDPEVFSNQCLYYHGSLTGGRHVLPCDKPMRGRYLLIRFKYPLRIDVEERFIHVCDVAFE